MADRPDLPRIFPTERPSMFNREAGGWSFFLGIAGGAVASLIMPLSAAPGAVYIASLVGTTLGMGAGFAFGGQKGMLRQAREMQGGRTVKDPTYLNSGIWNGLAVLKAVGLVSAAVLLLTGTAAIELAAAPVTLLSLGVLAGAVAIGSIVRKNSMQRDFDHALDIRAQAIETGRYKEVDAAHQLGIAQYKDSVTAQEAELLVSRQNAGSSHTSTLAQARAAAQTTHENGRG